MDIDEHVEEEAAAAANAASANPTRQRDSRVFAADDALATEDMAAPYFFVRSKVALNTALAAIASFDEMTARLYDHVRRRFAPDVDLAAQDRMCNDELLAACLHNMCSRIKERTTAVHFMNSAVAQTLHIRHDNETARQFATRMGIAHDDGEHTVFWEHSGCKAVVLPLHSDHNHHWSMLVFYRSESDARAWHAMHYDTLFPLNGNEALHFLNQLDGDLQWAEPGWHMQNPRHFLHTPRQPDGWSCGYRVIMMSLAVAYAEGNVDVANEIIQSNRYANDVACASYVAECLVKLCHFGYLVNVRDRNLNIVEIRAARAQPAAAAASN